MRKLLVVDPKKRLTAEAASRNCWVIGIGASTKSLPDVANRIKIFNEQQKSKARWEQLEIRPVNLNYEPRYLTFIC